MILNACFHRGCKYIMLKSLRGYRLVQVKQEFIIKLYVQVFVGTFYKIIRDIAFICENIEVGRPLTQTNVST